MALNQIQSVPLYSSNQLFYLDFLIKMGILAAWMQLIVKVSFTYSYCCLAIQMHTPFFPIHRVLIHIL